MDRGRCAAGGGGDAAGKPNINVLWAANEGGTVANVLAVQSAGLAGEVFGVRDGQ